MIGASREVAQTQPQTNSRQKTHRPIETQGLRRHLPSALCRSKLNAGPRECRGERGRGGATALADMRLTVRHWLQTMDSITGTIMLLLFNYFVSYAVHYSSL